MNTFHARDIIRLTREVVGTPKGSEGEVVGWYVNEPELIVVRLWDGGVQKVPITAIEVVRAAQQPSSA